MIPTNPKLVFASVCGADKMWHWATGIVIEANEFGQVVFRNRCAKDGTCGVN